MLLPSTWPKSRKPVRKASTDLRTSGCRGTQKSDPRHLAALLRARRQRPRRAAPPSSVMNSRRLHSITSSARASSVGGTSRPSILAVSALMTSSNLVDCTTGRSAGLAPLRMRPA